MFERKRIDINEGLKRYRSHTHALLVDVREEDEFEAGHAEGSVNLPLSRIEDAQNVLKDKEAQLFVYCRSGNRSAKACMILNGSGWKAENIGGILDYTGEVKYGKE